MAPVFAGVEFGALLSALVKPAGVMHGDPLPCLRDGAGATWVLPFLRFVQQHLPPPQQQLPPDAAAAPAAR